MKPRIKSSAQGGAKKIKLRRERVIERLSEQLKSGTKPLQSNPWSSTGSKAPMVAELEDSDRKRIEKELSILKTRI
jgi:hypothetical protein